MSSKCHISVIKLVFRPIMVVNNPYKHNLTINQSIQRILPVINWSQEVQKSCKTLVLNFDRAQNQEKIHFVDLPTFLVFIFWPKIAAGVSLLASAFFQLEQNARNFSKRPLIWSVFPFGNWFSSLFSSDPTSLPSSSLWINGFLIAVLKKKCKNYGFKIWVQPGRSYTDPFYIFISPLMNFAL